MISDDEMNKCRKSRCAQDFIARKISVNNHGRNLIKSRLEGVTCRSGCTLEKISLRHRNKKEDLGLATVLATGGAFKCRRSRKTWGAGKRIHDEYETGMR